MKKVTDELLYLSGVISENQYYEAVDVENKKLIERLSLKLGEKANAHMPLLRHISRNEKAAELFIELVKHLSLATPGKVKNLLKNKENDESTASSPNLKNLVRRIESRLGEGSSNRFMPLINHVSRNKNLLEDFYGLIKNLALVNASRVSRIVTTIDDPNPKMGYKKK